MNTKRYFALAKKEARRSTYKQRVGACIVTRKGEIFLGHNFADKTHPGSKTPYFKIHAEFDAIRKVKNPKKLKGATIFIARLMKTGFGIAAPCKDCRKLLSFFGFKGAYSTLYKSGDYLYEQI